MAPALVTALIEYPFDAAAGPSLTWSGWEFPKVGEWDHEPTEAEQDAVIPEDDHEYA